MKNSKSVKSTSTSTSTRASKGAKKTSKPRKGGKSCSTKPTVTSMVKTIITGGARTPQATYLTLLSKMKHNPSSTTVSEFFKNYKKFPSYRTVEQEFYRNRRTK